MNSKESLNCMKEEILDQIDSLREYPFFEFNLSEENDEWNDFDLNQTANLCREVYCKEKGLNSWEEYISQEQENYTDPNPNNFDINRWKEIVNFYFEEYLKN